MSLLPDEIRVYDGSFRERFELAKKEGRAFSGGTAHNSANGDDILLLSNSGAAGKKLFVWGLQAVSDAATRLQVGRPATFTASAGTAITPIAYGDNVGSSLPTGVVLEYGGTATAANFMADTLLGASAELDLSDRVQGVSVGSGQALAVTIATGSTALCSSNIQFWYEDEACG